MPRDKTNITRSDVPFEQNHQRLGDMKRSSVTDLTNIVPNITNKAQVSKHDLFLPSPEKYELNDFAKDL